MELHGGFHEVVAHSPSHSPSCSFPGCREQSSFAPSARLPQHTFLLPSFQSKKRSQSSGSGKLANAHTRGKHLDVGVGCSEVGPLTLSRAHRGSGATPRSCEAPAHGSTATKSSASVCIVNSFLLFSPTAGTQDS